MPTEPAPTEALDAALAAFPGATVASAAPLGAGVGLLASLTRVRFTDGTSVVVKGRASRLERQSEIDAADALPLRPWIPTLKYRWVKISPAAISGRWFERTPEPDRYVASREADTT